MSKAIAFLNNKGFHPGNMQNRRRVWIAEQKAEEQKKAAEERRKTLAEERARMEQRSLMGVSVDEQQLDFMYQAPEGLQEIQRREREQMLAEGDGFERPGQRGSSEQPGNKKGFYDKATIVAEHPALKNAPVVDKYAKNLGPNLNAKPLGIQVRRVRCLRCGEVGHVSGDRECPMKDQNPNEEFHRMVEDPMQAILAMRQQQQQQQLQEDPTKQGSLQLKAHIRRDLNFIEAPSTLAPAPAVAALPPQPATLQVTDEEAYLATLSRKEKKLLLKHLLAQEEKGETQLSVSDLAALVASSKKSKKDKMKEKKRQKDRQHRHSKKDKSKEKKSKSKKRKRHSSSSSSSSSSESSDSESSCSASYERRHRHKSKQHRTKRHRSSDEPNATAAAAAAAIGRGDNLIENS